jgi:hypothetical protein
MKNPRFTNPDNTGIILDLDDSGSICLFAEPYGDYAQVFSDAISGKFGTVAPYVAPPESTPEELTVIAEAKRQAAYTQEADPLFFKWQAGEATQEEWLAKREEIRLRYPYPTEE